MLLPVLLIASSLWSWPLAAPVAEGFTPPSTTWGSGHRGVDLAASPGQPVRAVAAGTVRFAGTIAGVATLSIAHDGVRSTYQPVRASVQVGETVTAGQVIGTVVGHLPHCAAPCLHLGAKVSGGYLNPLDLLTTAEIVLKPVDGPG